MITKGNKSLKENLKYCHHLYKQKESNEYPQKKPVKPINSFLSFIIMCFSLLHYINCCACLLANTHCQKHRCASSFSFGPPPVFPAALLHLVPSVLALSVCLIHYANLGPGHTCVRWLYHWTAAATLTLFLPRCGYVTIKVFNYLMPLAWWLI